MDHYAVLGLDHNCTLDDIKAQYRRLALVYHPDVNPGDEERSTQRTREINEAYEVLSDPSRRSQYHAQREASRSAAASDPLGQRSPRSHTQSQSYTYVWTKPPSEGVPRSAVTLGVAVLGVLAVLFRTGISQQYDSTMYNQQPASQSILSAANTKRQIASRYNQVITDANSRIADGDELIGTLTRQRPDMTQQVRLDQLDRDLHLLRTDIQDLEAEAQDLSQTTIPANAVTDITNDLNRTTDAMNSVHQEINLLTGRS